MAKKKFLSIKRKFLGDPNDDIRVRGEVAVYEREKSQMKGLTEEDGAFVPYIDIDISLRASEQNVCLSEYSSIKYSKDLQKAVKLYRQIADHFNKVADATEEAIEYAESR